MQKIAIDVREASGPKRAGKGQWTYKFVSELIKRDIPLLLVSDHSVPPEWKDAGHEVLIITGKGILWHFRVRRTVLRRQDIASYMSPTSYIIPALLGKKKEVMPVVHDLIAFRKEPHNRRAKWIERLLLKRAVSRASHIFTVSENTKQDLLDKYPSLESVKVTAIFAGPISSGHPQRLPDGKTILCVGTLCPRKNQLRLIRAFASLPDGLRSQYKLLLVGGRGWSDDAIVEAAADTEHVSWSGYLSDEEYEHLLSTCVVLALPSLYEGFGMQILDAMQMGVPVLTSRRGSLPEVAGGAAVYVDPEDVSSIAAGLREILKDTNLQRLLSELGPKQAAQFSWKRTVDLFLGSLHHS